MKFGLLATAALLTIHGAQSALDEMCSTSGHCSNRLSLPSAADSARAQAVSAREKLISNVPRTFKVANITYPYIDGPELVPGTFYYETLVEQLLVINTTENLNVNDIQAKLEGMGPFHSAESFAAGYEALETAGLIEKPQCLDNSDEGFGAMRLGVRGHNLHLVRSGEYNQYLDDLPRVLVVDQCYEKSIGEARLKNKVFVQDFTGYRAYSDESESDTKYAPSILGFFCYNSKSDRLLPLAIHILDTGLTYTKLDSEGEWVFAKMALDATELNFQQMRHLVETHLVSIPIQVEMIRSMAVEHPIYALLDYHFFGNFALENRGGAILFVRGAPYDRSMAFGAGGSMRYIVDEFANTTLADDLPTIIHDRGLSHLPSHRYVRYGSPYYSAVKAFVTSYVKVFYTSDAAIQSDSELQTWAKRASEVSVVNGFPTKFADVDTLVRLVTHLVFQNAVKHHFMNGAVSWHSVGAPFSAPALYGSKPLPASKGEQVDPLNYAVPSDVFAPLSYMAARFHRPILPKFSALQAYTTPPFSNESSLAAPIAKFHQTMALLEQFVDFMESKEKFPFEHIKPSLLPWYSYI